MVASGWTYARELLCGQHAQERHPTGVKGIEQNKRGLDIAPTTPRCTA